MDLNSFKTSFTFKGKPRCLSLDYRDLLNYCKSPDFDPKIFKIKHDEYAKKFGKLSLEEQGKVTETIYFYYKWAPVLEDEPPKMSDKSKRNVTPLLL